MAIVLSTKDVPAPERLGYWRDTASSRDVELNAAPGFQATLSQHSLDEVAISELHCDPCKVGRSARNIARADCDHFFLSLQLGGRAVATQDDRIAVGDNGGLILIDARRPYTLAFQGKARSIGFVLPRQTIESRVAHAELLTLRAMAASRPLAGLASGFLSMLPSRIDAVDRAMAVRLGEQTLDLIALALSQESDQTAKLSSYRGVALFRLKAVIESRLCDPALKPAAVARAAGISVRYANDLLSQEGFSIERYTLHRRLERSRRALEDGAQAHRLISEIAFAWGFSDLSHFNRRFRAEYGLTPGDCRRRAQAHAAAHTKETEEDGAATQPIQC